MQPKTNILTACSLLLALGTKTHNHTRPPWATARMHKNGSLHLLVLVPERARKFSETRTAHQSRCPSSPLNLHDHDLFRGNRPPKKRTTVYHERKKTFADSTLTTQCPRMTMDGRSTIKRALINKNSLLWGVLYAIVVPEHCSLLFTSFKSSASELSSWN